MLSRPRCLVPYMLLCLTCLVPYMLSCPKRCRASRASFPTCCPASRCSCLSALVPYMFRTSCVLVLDVRCSLRALRVYVPRALCAAVHHLPRVIVPSCLTCSRTLRALVPHMSYVLFILTCLVLCMFSCCSCLVPYVLLCSSFLTCCGCFKPNMLTCISRLIAFMSCASCAFGS